VSGWTWFTLLAPPAAWAFQEWLGWFFGQRTCTALAPASVRWVLLAVSLAALVITLTGVARGWGLWREGDPDHHDRGDFMAFGGLLVSGIFTIAVIWAGLSTAFLSDCGVMR
jgi:hypothetical protein